MIGPRVPKMTFPICNVFEPTVYRGRQCYQVKIKRIPGHTVSQGKKNSLMLLIDVNPKRSFKIETKGATKAERYERDVYFGEEKITNKNLAIVHIGTLAPHSEEGPGDYVLTSLKQMTGTASFLGWPQQRRKCALEDFETCQMKLFLENIFQCGCTPFQLVPSAGPTYKVCLDL